MVKKSKTKAIFENESLILYNDLYQYAFSITRNKDDAKDLVQEVYLKAYKNIDKFKLGTNARAWLYKIMYNHFCSQYRKKTKIKFIADDYNVENIKVVENKISKVEIIDSINNLGKKYKFISVLFFLNEFSYSEIEKITELKLGTVKSRIYRSRELIKDEIDHRLKYRLYLKAV